MEHLTELEIDNLIVGKISDEKEKKAKDHIKNCSFCKEHKDIREKYLKDIAQDIKSFSEREREESKRILKNIKSKVEYFSHVLDLEDEKHDILENPIEYLNLSVRARNVFKGHNINTVGDLVRLAADNHNKFKYLRNFGTISFSRLCKGSLYRLHMEVCKKEPEHLDDFIKKFEVKSPEKDWKVLSEYAQRISLSILKCLENQN